MLKDSNISNYIGIIGIVPAVTNCFRLEDAFYPEHRQKLKDLISEATGVEYK